MASLTRRWLLSSSTSLALPNNLRVIMRKLLGSAVLVFIVLTWTLTPLSYATRVPAKHPRIPGTVIACHHQRTDRFTAEVRPARCDLKGTEGKGRKPATVPIEVGRWDFWGTFNSRGSRGVEVRTGAAIRVFAFRRVECRDGRVWYSGAVIFDPGNSKITVLRLPTCEALP
jgi:hypothetical protein